MARPRASVVGYAPDGQGGDARALDLTEPGGKVGSDHLLRDARLECHYKGPEFLLFLTGIRGEGG